MSLLFFFILLHKNLSLCDNFERRKNIFSCTAYLGLIFTINKSKVIADQYGDVLFSGMLTKSTHITESLKRILI